MKDTIHFGRIRGIEVGAHWSVLVIGWLLAWALADTTFPGDAPHEPEILYWVAAVITVGAFWAGLLAHELAHSVVATRLGVQVDGITLWLFGGVSRLRGEAQTPGAELRIALAGPATSLAIAGTSGVSAWGLDALDGPRLVVASLTWLAVINGLLAGFNLAPAAPLDGGRVLHAIVWLRTKDRLRATEIATNSGQAFGYLLVGAGVLLLAAGDLGGVWFAFLGWFLLNAARAEATHVLVHEALANVRVRDVMSPEPLTAPAGITIEELLDEHMLRRHCSAFPIVDRAGEVIGLVTLQQVKAVHPGRRSQVLVDDVAWPVDAVARAAPDDPLVEAIDRIATATGGDGRALVFTDGGLVGIVSPTDLQRALELARLHQPAAAAPSDEEDRDGTVSRSS